jgi:hypothetical protein
LNEGVQGEGWNVVEVRTSWQCEQSVRVVLSRKSALFPGEWLYGPFLSADHKRPAAEKTRVLR